MAKDIDLDDINFDDEDFNFDFDIKPEKDNRSPVKKIASGAVKGFKSSFTDTNFLRRKMLQILPPGYTKASDELGKVGSELTDLYNSAAKEMEPVRKAGVRITKSMLPKLKGKLPKKLEAKLQGILDDAERNKTQFGVDQDQANMTLEMGEIFKTQMEHQEQIREKGELADRAKIAIGFKQHKESIVELASLRQGMDKLVGYQDSINFKYQKKSLELQFKQYFIQRDMLELSKTTNKTVLESLQGILKNTALPENAKVNTSEIGHQMLKERMLKSLGGTAADYAPNFIKNFGQNIRNKMKMELSALSSMASMGSMLDPAELEAMGIDPTEMMGEGIGGMGADYLSDSLIYKYKDKIPFKNKINKVGNKMSIWSNELPMMAEDWRKKQTTQGGVRGALMNFVKSTMPRFNLKTQLESDNIKDANTASSFDNHTRKSIVEIIPGYLARILQSIDILRTGDANAELVNYDLINNKFAGTTELKNTLMKRMFSKSNITKADSETSYVLEHLDKDKKLSPNLRKVLKSQILADSQLNKRISIDRYLNESEYQSFVKPKEREKLIAFFQGVKNQGDGDNKFAEELSRRSSSLKYNVTNTREMAQQFMNAGYGDLLEQTGVVTKSGMVENLDFNKVMEVYREGGYQGEAPPTPSQGRRKGIRRSIGPRPISTEIPTQTYRNDYQGPAVNDCCSETKTFLEEFKNSLFESISNGRTLDEERNIKLDEIIIRMEGLGNDGVNTGIGTRSFKERTRSLSKRLKGAGGTAYRKATSLGKGYLGFVKSIYSGGFNAVKEIGGGTIKGTKDAIFNKVQDVYLKGNLKVPKLRADLLRAGEYRDKVTGKVIRSVSDIKGEIVDSKNNLVLSLSDIREGLVNGRGEKIRGFISRFFGGSFELLGKLGRGYGDLTGALLKVPTTAINFITDKLGSSKTDEDVYLKEEKKPRLTVAKLNSGHYFDGQTGKVISSFKNLKNGVKDKKGRWLLTPEESGGGLFKMDGSILSKPFNWLLSVPGGILKLYGKALKGGASLVGKAVGKFKEGMSPTSVQVSLLTQIRDILDDRLADQTVDRLGSAEDILNKRKGRKGKTADNLGSSKDKKDKKGKDADGSGDSSLLETLFGLKMGIDGLSSVGGWAVKGAASIAAGVASGTGIGGTLAAIGTGAMSIGSAALTGLAGMISAPVLLGAAAVAGVAYGGYKLYKYLKKKDAWLTKIRMAQYGVDPTDSDRVELIGDLESLLVEKLVAANGGFDIKGDEDTPQEILDIFDIDSEDKEAMKFFGTWFVHRFKPIFLAHATATNRFAKGTSLLEADDNVPMKSKLEYIKIVSFGNGQTSPYLVPANPFDGTATLPVGEELPKQYIDPAIEFYKKAMEKEGVTDKSTSKATAALAGAAAGTIAAQAIKTAPPSMSMLAKLSSIMPSTSTLAKGLLTFTVPGMMGLSIAGKLADFIFGKAETMDALLAVRLKAYGLKDVSNKEQIKALLLLEDAVLRKAKLGSDGQATVEISVEDMFNSHATNFGLSPGNSDNFQQFGLWFKTRFLPVALKYFTLVRTIDATLVLSKAEEKLKPSQKASIAKELVNVKTDPKSNVAIWTINISPFEGQESNTDSESCKGHIKYLESMTSDKELKTQEAVVKKVSTGSSKSMLDSLKSGLSNVWGNLKSGASGLWDKAKDAYEEQVDKASRGMGYVADKASGAYNAASGLAKDVAMAAGSLIKHPGKGTGGDINMLPQPDGPDGKFNTYKSIIAGAAKMVGVDPTLMATMANIESGFKATVKAGTSSATGLYQFIRSTWDEMIGKYGAKYGIARGTPPTDPRANALMGAEFIKDNMEFLSKHVDRPLTDGDVYAAHFLGPKGARQLLTSDPNANAVSLMPQAAAANGPIFYNKNGSPRTVAEVYNHLSGLMKNKRIELPGGSIISPKDAVAANVASAAGVPPFLAKPGTQTPAPPSMLAKPQAPQTAVAGLMNMNPMDVSGMMKTPNSDSVAANTTAVNTVIDAATDKQNSQTTTNQDYQAVALEAQRKASSDYLNGGIDSVANVLNEQLTVQKSIDTNIKRLVDELTKNGSPSLQQNPSQPTQVNQPASKESGLITGKTVVGPVSMRRTNV